MRFAILHLAIYPFNNLIIHPSCFASSKRVQSFFIEILTRFPLNLRTQFKCLLLFDLRILAYVIRKARSIFPRFKALNNNNRAITVRQPIHWSNLLHFNLESIHRIATFFMCFSWNPLLDCLVTKKTEFNTMLSMVDLLHIFRHIDSNNNKKNSAKKKNIEWI